MTHTTIDDIEQRVLGEISKHVSEFREQFKAGTKDTENIMTISEIENNRHNLQQATEKSYSDMVGKMISAIDERAIIRKKKENSENSE
jgi:hypothetical protein